MKHLRSIDVVVWAGAGAGVALVVFMCCMHDPATPARGFCPVKAGAHCPGAGEGGKS